MPRVMVHKPIRQPHERVEVHRYSFSISGSSNDCATPRQPQSLHRLIKTLCLRSNSGLGSSSIPASHARGIIIAPCTAAKTNLSRLGHGGEEFQPRTAHVWLFLTSVVPPRRAQLLSL